MKTTRHDVLTCPVCKAEMDASTDVTDDNRSPYPGGVTVCVYCGSVLMYGEGLRLTQTWDPAILDHPEVVKLVDAWKKATGNG